MESRKPLVIGIAGGSGSGKTSVTHSIYDVFKEHSVVVIEQDYYYKDQSHLALKNVWKRIMIIRWHLIRIY